MVVRLAGDSLGAPSSFCKDRKWADKNLLFNHNELLQTHRCPAPAHGYLHISTTTPEIAHIYQVHEQGVAAEELTAKDHEFAFTIADLSCDVYRDEPHRAEAVADHVLSWLCPNNADKQLSLTNVRNRNDGAITRKGPRPHALLHLELKNELGQSGDPVMEVIAYHAKYAARKVDALAFSHPSILVTISGPHVIVYCGAWTDRCFQYDHLDSISLLVTADPLTKMRQAKFWKLIKAHVQYLADQPVEKQNQLGYPHINQCASVTQGEAPIAFVYTGTLGTKDGVFLAKERDSGVILILSFFF